MNNFFDHRLYSLPLSQKIVLLNQFADSENIDLILEKSAKLIGNPIVLSNPYFKVEHCYPNEYINDSDYDYMIQYGIVDTDIIYKYEMAEQTSFGFRAINVRALTARKEICMLTSNNKQIGQLIVYSIFRKLREEDYILLKLLSKIITLIKIKSPIYLHNSGSFYQSLIYDLIEDTNVDVDKYKALFENIHVNIYSDYYMVLVKLNKELEECTRMKLEGYENIICLMYHGDYIMVMNRDSYIEHFKDIKEIITPYVDKLAVSSPFRNLYELHDIYYYTTLSFKTEELFHLNKKFFSVSELSFYNTYFNYVEQGIDIYLNQKALEIIKHDEDNGTDYAQSLFIYLLEFGNLKRASDRLVIHRNTLDYKVKKISQIFNLDLEDFEQNFEILCTLKVILKTTKKVTR